MAAEDRSFEESGCRFKICLSGEIKETLSENCQSAGNPTFRDPREEIRQNENRKSFHGFENYRVFKSLTAIVLHAEMTISRGFFDCMPQV